MCIRFSVMILSSFHYKVIPRFFLCTLYMGNEEGLNSSRFSTSITRLSCQDENGFFSCLCYALRNTLQWSEITSEGVFLFKHVSCFSDFFWN